MQISRVIREVVSGRSAALNDPIFPSRVHREVLSGERPAKDSPIFPSRVLREVLYQDLAVYHVARVHREVLSGERPAKDTVVIFARVHREVLYKPQALTIPRVMRETLYQYQDTPTVFSQNRQGWSSVIAAHPYLPVDETLSYETILFNASFAAQKADDFGMPWSYSSARELWALVAQSRPLSAQSLETVRSLRALVSSRALISRIEDLWSSSSVSSAVVLVCQSLDIPYQPTSGAYVRSINVLSAIQSDALPMWTSPAITGSWVSLAIQRRPVERLPQSVSRVAQSTTIVATKRDDARLPMSNSDVNQSLTIVATASDEQTMPMSHIDTQAFVSLAVQESPIEVDVVGVVQTAAVVSLHAIESPIEPSIGIIESAELRVNVAQTADGFPLPDSMLIRARVGQNVSQAIIAAPYTPVDDLRSNIAYATAQTQIIQRSVYPDPDDMIDDAENRRVGQLQVLSAQRLIRPLPISNTPVGSFIQKVIAAEPMPSPGDMATSGIFAPQIIEHVANVANYPDPVVPTSFVHAVQIIEHAVSIATYPDAHMPTSTITALQVVQHGVSVASYPDAATLFKPLLVAQVIEHAAQDIDYPAWQDVHRPLNVAQVIQHGVSVAMYPDKDIPQSFLMTGQVLEHASQSVIYPDKDIPQSKLTINSVLENVARVDLSLYVMPQPPRKHRVRISCRFVYE